MHLHGVAPLVAGDLSLGTEMIHKQQLQAPGHPRVSSEQKLCFHDLCKGLSTASDRHVHNPNMSFVPGCSIWLNCHTVARFMHMLPLRMHLERQDIFHGHL